MVVPLFATLGAADVGASNAVAAIAASTAAAAALNGGRGVAWLPEFWLTCLLGGALVFSLWRDSHIMRA